MIYLVDGHNLIPKVPGFSLRSVDDEMQLVELLQIFARLKRKKVEIYFDKAAVGQAGTKKIGMITVHFVRQGSSADQAIRQRLEKSIKENHNYRVVTSDHAVQNAARLNQAEIQSSESFVKEVMDGLYRSNQESNSTDQKVVEEEVNEWLEVFNQNKTDEAD
jgi:uncharacterized protein